MCLNWPTREQFLSLLAVYHFHQNIHLSPAIAAIVTAAYIAAGSAVGMSIAGVATGDVVTVTAAVVVSIANTCAVVLPVAAAVVAAAAVVVGSGASEGGSTIMFTYSNRTFKLVQ